MPLVVCVLHALLLQVHYACSASGCTFCAYPAVAGLFCMPALPLGFAFLKALLLRVYHAGSGSDGLL